MEPMKTVMDAATNATILTVEDDPVVRDSIVIWLEDADFDVLEADNGTDGLELFQQNTPDVVLLDLGIPGIEGSKLLEIITGEAPETPVIVVSGRAEIDDAIRAFKAGAWDYITKPIVNMDMLEKTVRNCLERKHLKECLTLAEHRYYSLVQNLPVIVFSMNDRMELTFVNEASLPVLGFSPKDALSSPNWFLDQVCPIDKDFVRNAIQAAFTQPETSFSLEFQFQHKNGYLVQLQAQSVSIAPPQDGGSGRIEGVLVDITERAFLDKMLVQREKLNTLGAMADEIAHEFRNPIFALGGFARRLQEKQPDLTETTIILSEAKRLEELLESVKDYLRPVQVTRQQCSLNAIIRFCVDLLKPRLARHQISPHLELDKELAPIESDQDILTQIGMNLLSNALQQISDGNEMHIRSYETPTQQGIDISVPLNGKAATFRQGESLLLPFERNGTEENLAVSYRLAKNVDAYLSVTREEKELVLTLALPVHEPQHKS